MINSTPTNTFDGVCAWLVYEGSYNVRWLQMSYSETCKKQKEIEKISKAELETYCYVFRLTANLMTYATILFWIYSPILGVEYHY